MTYQVLDGYIGCGACLSTCLEHAIRPGDGRPLVVVVVRAERCTGCGECIAVRPADPVAAVPA